MKITKMFKPMRPRRNSLPSNTHRSKTKVLPKTDCNPLKSSKLIHDSRKPKSKTPACVKHLSYDESHSKTKIIRNFVDRSLSDGDDNITDDRTLFHKGTKRNQHTKDKRPNLLRSQPIDTPFKRLQDVPLHHSPPSYESPKKFGQCKKFKEDDIQQMVIEKYALLQQLMSFNERCQSPGDDKYYAGAKFNNCPSPGDLPLPPTQWLSSCQAEAKKMQKSHLLFNITI
ncbi:uncharacterized protein LOC126844327 [Adelges cooleyi]|uniref:uncharacterized protein LOC126844327 n=1 Tax=Adelges cooleyi TaxID=133065 RepID=UPI0021804C04|nr:uncharacterized protein LOC126844327 [Adelges cooleyi]